MPTDCELAEAAIEYYQAAEEYDDAQAAYWQAQKLSDSGNLLTAQMWWWWYCQPSGRAAIPAGSPPLAEAIANSLQVIPPVQRNMARYESRIAIAKDRKAVAYERLTELLAKYSENP